MSSARKVAARILAGVGTALLVGGVLTFVMFPRYLDAESARIEQLRQVDGVILHDTPAGREILIEGRISATQPVLFRNFVAYARAERERTRDEPRWRGHESRLPSLLLDTAEGTVRVVNADYGLRNLATEWIDPRLNGRWETRYQGVAAGEPVVVIGKAAPGGVAAEFVSSGTRASFVAAQTRGRTVAIWLGRGLAGIGSLLLVIAASLSVPGWRRGRFGVAR